MAGRISRRKLAVYTAVRLLKGDGSAVFRELAAYLVETRRVRELELIVRDIELALAERGMVVADVASARPLTDSLKNEIKQLTGGKDLALRETLDESLLGGVKINLPGKRLDATLRHKLQALKQTGQTA
jgi:F-type H+-transporting ATPase subunit delta